LAKQSTETNAVIVSTARTALAKSWKGAFNMTHGATLCAHSVQHVIARAGIDSAEPELYWTMCSPSSRWPAATRFQNNVGRLRRA
jgi:acetyl-CoA acetyltransferase